jgi:hypothetical protein
MAQFEGGNKVRCADCTKLSGKTCTAKNTSVAVKKRRACGQYNFAGEYVNNTPLPTTYMPPVDKKTARLMRKLMKMGVLPMTGDRPVPTIKSDIYDPDNAPINPAAFQTTATAADPVVMPEEHVGEIASDEVKAGEGTTVMWSPEGAESEEK